MFVHVSPSGRPSGCLGWCAVWPCAPPVVCCAVFCCAVLCCWLSVLCFAQWWHAVLSVLCGAPSLDAGMSKTTLAHSLLTLCYPALLFVLVDHFVDETGLVVCRLIAHPGVSVHLLQQLVDVQRPGPRQFPFAALFAPLAGPGLGALSLAGRLSALGSSFLFFVPGVVALVTLACSKKGGQQSLGWGANGKGKVHGEQQNATGSDFGGVKSSKNIFVLCTLLLTGFTFVYTTRGTTRNTALCFYLPYCAYSVGYLPI